MIVAGDADQEAVKGKIAVKLYFASLYFVTVGVLYLWGYWPQFGVNILEFLNFTDILKVTAYPIAVAALVITLGSALGSGAAHVLIRSNEDEKSSAHWDHASEDELDREIARLRARSDRFKKIGKLLKVLYFVVTFVVVIGVVADWKPAWLILPCVMAGPFTIWIVKHPNLAPFIRDDAVRMVAALFIASPPLYAYAFGRTNAINIIDGTSYYYVISDVAGHTGSISDQTFRFIGHAGDFVFLYDANKEATIFIKLDDDKAIALKKHTSVQFAPLRSLFTFLKEAIIPAAGPAPGPKG